MLAPPGFIDLELSGTGATSRVYRATDARSGATVALKRLHRQLVTNDDALTRLRREFRALSRLRHPSIVAARDVIRWHGDPTLIMDFIEGRDLEDVLADGPLPSAEVERIARALIDVLEASHGAGIVHRDIKPQNVRLGDDGQVYLLDFGSARLDAASHLTATGTTVGTPDYMPPELFAGSVYDPRADIYGLGATLYRCATGVVPQQATTLTELAYKRTHEKPKSAIQVAPKLSRGLGAMIDRCLAAAPDDRFSSAALARFSLDHPTVAGAYDEARSRRPPCLHCGAALARDSQVCAACESDHPFRYEAGPAHVVITRVPRPADLAAVLERRFPERATPNRRRALAERIAAVAQAPQTLVSFIDEDEASKLESALADAGVESHVARDEGTTGWRLYGVGLAGFAALALLAGVVLGVPIAWHHALLLIAPAIGALLADRLTALGRSQQSILSDTRMAPPAVPGARPPLLVAVAVAATGAVFSGPLVATLTAATGLAFTGVEVATGLAWAAAGVLAAVMAASWGLSTAGRGVAGSPEPALIDKARQAFSVQTASGRRTSMAMAALLATTVVGLVPFELAALATIHDGVATGTALVGSTVSPTDPTPATGPVVDDAPIGDVAIETVLAEPSVTAPAHALPPNPAPTDDPAPLAPLLATPGLLIAAALLLRRRRIKREAVGILHAFAGTPHLDPPATRRRGSKRPADQLAHIDAKDGFIAAARLRASALAHDLEPEHVERLRWAIETLGRGGTRADRSLIARSILDTDPDQRLRFEYLNLEGRLEADAARKWVARLDAGGER